MNFHTQFNYKRLILKRINLFILHVNDAAVNSKWENYVFYFLMPPFKDTFNNFILKLNHKFVVDVLVRVWPVGALVAL